VLKDVVRKFLPFVGRELLNEAFATFNPAERGRMTGQNSHRVSLENIRITYEVSLNYNTRVSINAHETAASSLPSNCKLRNAGSNKQRSRLLDPCLISVRKVCIYVYLNYVRFRAEASIP